MTYRATAAAALILLGVVAGCGGSDTASAPAVPAPVLAPTPESCLEAAGLSQIEQRDVDLWRGVADVPYYLVRVTEMESSAAAARAVNDATDVWASAGGTYAVFGPLRDIGSGPVVRAVADCLSS